MNVFRSALFAALLATMVTPASAAFRTAQISLNGNCNVITLTWDEQTVSGQFAGTDCHTGLGTGTPVTKIPKGLKGHYTILGVRFDGDSSIYYLILTNDYRRSAGGFYGLYGSTDGIHQGMTGGSYSPVKDGAVENHGAQSVTKRLK